MVLERDGYVCQIRGTNCRYVANVVHHTIGKEFGDDPAYLIAACEWCNAHIGKPNSDLPNKNITEW